MHAPSPLNHAGQSSLNALGRFTLSTCLWGRYNDGPALQNMSERLRRSRLKVCCAEPPLPRNIRGEGGAKVCFIQYGRGSGIEGE
jgi:hypothetical protein